LSFPVFFLRRQRFSRIFHRRPYILAASKITPNRSGQILVHVRNAGTPEMRRSAPGSRPALWVPNANNSVEIQTKLRNSLERVDYVLDESLL